MQEERMQPRVHDVVGIGFGPSNLALAVVKRGSYMPLDLKAFWPLRTPTPLAVPYVVDNVVPKIAEAAGKAKSA
jgi:hypothetical protein